MAIHLRVFLIMALAVTSLQFCSTSNTQSLLPHDLKTIISSGAKMLNSLENTKEILRGNHITMRAPPSSATNWTVRSQQFYKIVHDLGLFKIGGITLHKVPQQTVDRLKAAKDNVLIVKKRSNPTSKRQFHDFCLEKKVTNVVLAYAGEKLAYKIQSVECKGVCHSKALKLTLGKCVLRRKDFIVYIQDDKNNFVPKVVKIGCACECLHYARFQ